MYNKDTSAVTSTLVWFLKAFISSIP